MAELPQRRWLRVHLTVNDFALIARLLDGLVVPADAQCSGVVFIHARMADGRIRVIPWPIVNVDQALG